MKKILFIITLALCLSEVLAQPVPFLHRVIHDDAFGGDQLGHDVSISGNYAVVGTVNEPHDLNGENLISMAGSAYVFERDSATGAWAQVQKLIAPDRATLDQFGYSVAIDGDYIAIGASGHDFDEDGNNPMNNSGAVYIFRRDGEGVWQQTQKLVPFTPRIQGEQFGVSVDMDNGSLLVGAMYEGFGANPSAEYSSGAAYVFSLDSGGVWQALQKLKASDYGYVALFGTSVSVDGHHILIGASGERKDLNGQNATVSAGAAYFFERDASNGMWTEVQKVVNANRARYDIFGESVSVSGDYAVVGEPGQYEDNMGQNPLVRAGAVYVYQRNPGTGWVLEHVLNSPHRQVSAYFGDAVSMDGDRLLVGSPDDNLDEMADNYLLKSGAVYVYERDMVGDWNMTQKLLAPTRRYGARFGNVVCAQQGEIIIGAFLENPSGFPNSSTGAAYIASQSPLTSIKENDFGSAALAYPNPTQGALEISLGETYERGTVQVQNMMGQQISMQGFTRTDQVSLSIKRPAGLYLVTVRTASGKVGTWKIWKK